MTTYMPCPATVVKMAGDIILKHHYHLEDARVDFIFRDKTITSKGREVLGRARLVTGLNQFLAHSDDPFFVIELCAEPWEKLDDKGRKALLDHELAHCKRELNEEKGRWELFIQGHDYEEFVEIIERHGFWHQGQSRIQEAVQQRLKL